MYLILIIFLLLSIFIYLLLIRPAPLEDFQSESMKRFASYYFAHRGFYDNEHHIPENSMAAYKRAIHKGFGIELDVQLTSDHKLVVFHDKTLKRMCGIRKNISDCTYEELQKYVLMNSRERIPLFSEAIHLIDGQVPLIIEVKNYYSWENVVDILMTSLDGYEGDYLVVSFSNKILAWFRKHHPEIIRGQIIEGKKWSKGKKKYLRNLPKLFLLSNSLGRPHLFSYKVEDCGNISYQICRKLFKVYDFHWPNHCQEDLERFQGEKDLYVFEWFEPLKKL